MNDDDIDVLAGEYVLGTLSADERSAVQRRLEAREEPLRSAVARWEAALLPLTALAPPVSPSEQLWPRIEAGIAPVARSAPVAAAPRWWQRIGFWRATTALATAVSVALAFLLVAQRVSPPTPRFVVVLVAPDTGDPGVLMQAVDDRRLNLIPLGTLDVPADRVLELWTHPGGGEAVVSLGLVTPGHSRSLSLEAYPPLQPGQAFAISVEPPGGSPTGQPTGPVRYSGRTVSTL